MSWTSDTQVSPAWFWGQSSKRQNKGALLPSDSSSVPRFPLIDSWDTPPSCPRTTTAAPVCWVGSGGRPETMSLATHPDRSDQCQVSTPVEFSTGGGEPCGLAPTQTLISDRCSHHDWFGTTATSCWNWAIFTKELNKWKWNKILQTEFELRDWLIDWLIDSPTRHMPACRARFTLDTFF